MATTKKILFEDNQQVFDMLEAVLDSQMQTSMIDFARGDRSVTFRYDDDTKKFLDTMCRELALKMVGDNPWDGSGEKLLKILWDLESEQALVGPNGANEFERRVTGVSTYQVKSFIRQWIQKASKIEIGLVLCYDNLDMDPMQGVDYIFSFNDNDLVKALNTLLDKRLGDSLKWVGDDGVCLLRHAPILRELENKTGDARKAIMEYFESAGIKVKFTASNPWNPNTHALKHELHNWYFMKEAHGINDSCDTPIDRATEAELMSFIKEIVQLDDTSAFYEVIQYEE